MLHVVTYEGPLGFIKPAAAVRDMEIYSQRFLAPSTVEGMRQKLGVTSVDGVRLYCPALSRTQREMTRGPRPASTRSLERDRSIVDRHLLVNPALHLAFASLSDADRAAAQHLCLCRNEDVVLPTGRETMTHADFDALPGFTFVRDPEGDAIAGYNRYTDTYDRGYVEYVSS
jgi:hypothetical protein